jgi:hypothetical protein
VDLGRVQLAKNQLRSACDAAALAAGEYVLSDVSAAKSVAIATAKQNFADGKKVEITSADVTPVYWNEKTHKVESLPAGKTYNAVRVVAARTAEKGNAIDLPFARMIGATTCDIHAEAIALAKPQKYAIVGLDFVKMGGNSSNGYKKPGQFDYNGSVASNGDITLTGSSWIQGDAFPGVGKRVIGANHVSGSTNPLAKPLVYPMPTLDDAATNNNNAAIPTTILSAGAIKVGSQKNVPLPGGVYYVKGIELGAGSELSFTGPATLYVEGNVSLGGHASAYGDKPENLKIIVLGTGRTVDLNGSSALYADIYAPGAALDMHGTGDTYGALVAKSISMTGTSAVHYDLSLKGGVSLVK